jgi:tRNA-specific 2-thiouridylase
VPDGDYRSFLSQRSPQRAGDIVDQAGAVVGQHEGVAGFTIGQRKGIGAFGGKRFVTEIDPQLNVVTIGEESDLLTDRLRAEKPSWTNNAPPSFEFDATVKVRYKSPAAPARVHVEGDEIVVDFEKPLRAITPGQAVVIYDGDCVVGGGIIARTERREAAPVTAGVAPATAGATHAPSSPSL